LHTISLTIHHLPPQSEDVPSIEFPPLSTPQQLDQEQQWVSNMVRLWLNEEWTPLYIHKDLGDAAGKAYKSQRLAGCNEAGDVLLGLSSDLLAFNYRDTFVNGFEVANKVIELLMLRQGCDVCCTSESDRNAIDRYENMLQEEQEREGKGEGGK